MEGHLQSYTEPVGDLTEESTWTRSIWKYGEGAIDQLKTEYMVEFLTMTREFEVKKRTVHESLCSNYISRLSIVLNDKLNNDEKMKKSEVFVSQRSSHFHQR